ncbi:MAG: chemotaxis protein CheZ, partial [Desulfovibrio sp.]|nr:chemotaxis protein CheZ [Desulfovibrio sp.]
MSDEKAEPAVYRQLSADMREGLKGIYQQISTASQNTSAVDSNTDALFHEATAQLAEVLKATEKATMSIMEIVERQLDIQEKNAELLALVHQGTIAPSQIATLEDNNRQMGDDLSSVLTTLSFQDITG